MCQENLLHYSTTTPTTLKLEIRAMLSSCYFLTLPSECHRRNGPGKLRPGNVFTIFHCPNLMRLCNFSFRFITDRSSTRCVICYCSPPASRCSAFRDALLHILVATTGYLSYHCFPISSNHSGYSPLTSTKCFHPENFHSLQSFPRPSSAKLRDFAP